MKKNIEWLKNEVNKLPLILLGFSILKQREEYAVDKDDVLKLINQLDEQEVLSLEWINEKAVEVYTDTADAEVHAVFRMQDLQNLLVPTLSEMEKVQLSQKTADELNRYKELGYSLKDLLFIADSKQTQEKLARAWLNGFTVEEEQKYYARIKGWENITTGSEAFNWAYFKEKDTVGISKAVENRYQAVSFTKYDWKNLGISEHNADFVLLKEVEA